MPGPPRVCAACRTMMHPPREDCPTPFECTLERGTCTYPGCENWTPPTPPPPTTAMDRKIHGVVSRLT